jgi:hypothetical protein
MPWIVLDLTDRQVSLPDLMNSHGARLVRLQFLHLSPESYSSDYKLLTDVKYEQFPHVSIVNQRKGAFFLRASTLSPPCVIWRNI